MLAAVAASGTWFWAQSSAALIPIEHVAPGIYSAPPLGIAAVHGECEGVIAITPMLQDAARRASYPVLYHCDTKTWEVPAFDAAETNTFFADLTLTDDGYYLNVARFVDLAATGTYSIRGADGRERRRIERPFLDAHDLLLDADTMTYMAYVPNADAGGCGAKAPVELEIVEEGADGRERWRWSSKGRFEPAWKVPTADALRQAEGRVHRNFRPVRNCYTWLAGQVVAFETPALFVRGSAWPLLHMEQDDYVHANSMARVNAAGDVLVSARHLDAVFVIERATGHVRWSLGGPHAKMTQNRPIGDPRGGFSHQHTASLAHGQLVLFDNANNHPGQRSRAVTYAVDRDRLGEARFMFEFEEPRGTPRPMLGSTQLIDAETLLVGWGGVEPPHNARVQRAVSIVDVPTRAETFWIDFAPGWMSYRAKHAR